MQSEEGTRQGGSGEGHALTYEWSSLTRLRLRGAMLVLRGARLSRPRLDGILTAFYESQDSESRECAVWVCVQS